MRGSGKYWWIAGASAGGFLAARMAARKRRRWLFSGRSVVITGGSRGLGLLLARKLAREGALITILARDQDELDRASAELREMAADVLALRCDLTERPEVNRALGQAEQMRGRIDVLINNAGIIQVGPVETMTEQAFKQCMDIHFWASLHAIEAALPGMKARGEGRIVNISSIGGLVSVPHLLPYCASKFALTGLSDGLRAELMKDGIYVTTVCPGLMRTGSHLNAQFRGQHRVEYTLFSLSGTSPITSMDASRAADQVLTACRYGDARVVLSAQAKALALFHGLFPGATSDLLGAVNRLLPGPDAAGESSHSGRESESALSPGLLTQLGDRAAAENNELP